MKSANGFSNKPFHYYFFLIKNSYFTLMKKKRKKELDYKLTYYTPNYQTKDIDIYNIFFFKIKSSLLYNL